MAPTAPSFAALSNEELAAVVPRLAASERDATAALVAALAEIDARGLHAREGYSSLFAYCTGRLHLSEPASCRRIQAARAARRFPTILQRLAEGALTLAAVGMLAPHLTPENHVAVLDAARHRSKRDVEELVAALSPQPDIPSSVRKLPGLRAEAAERNAPCQPSPAARVAAPRSDLVGTPRHFAPPGTVPTLLDAPAAQCATAWSLPGTGAQRPVQRDGPLAGTSPSEPNSAGHPGGLPADEEFSGAASIASRPAVVTVAPARPPVIGPLSPARYQVKITVSAETHEKLVRARDLLRHAIPSGDPALVIDRALTVLLERLEKAKFALVAPPPPAAAPGSAPKRRRPKRPATKAGAASRERPAGDSSTTTPEGRRVGDTPTARPAGSSPVGDPSPGQASACGPPAASAPARPRYISAEVRREIWARSQGQCEFVSESGRRCESRAFLEFHHRVPFASGGVSSATNCAVYCKSHNQHEAEVHFGRAFVAARRGVSKTSTRPRTPTIAVISPSLATVEGCREAGGLAGAIRDGLVMSQGRGSKLPEHDGD